MPTFATVCSRSVSASINIIFSLFDDLVYLTISYRCQYDQAINRLLKVVETNSSFYPAHVHLGIAYAKKCRFPEAIATLKKLRQLEAMPWTVGWLGHAYAVASRRDEALKILDELKEG
jgi:tetratricopeptide (TPR) repeat protein